MLLRQLEYLDALARERHFGRAAKACHVSQPALSSALGRLEVELGVSLVRRGRRYEGLTPEGEELLAWARAALASVSGLTVEASRLRGSLTATLRLGAIPTVAARLGEVLQPFTSAHPGVRVNLSTATAVAILAAIDARELDGGFVYLDTPLTDPVHTVPLYRDEMVLLTSDPAFRTTGGAVTWEEASTLPLSLLPTEMQKRQFIDQAFAAAGVHVRAHVEADSVAALIEFGLAGGSCIVGERWLRGRNLPPSAQVRPLTPAVAPTVGLVTPSGPLAPPAARLLRDVLATSADSRAVHEPDSRSARQRRRSRGE